MSTFKQEDEAMTRCGRQGKFREDSILLIGANVRALDHPLLTGRVIDNKGSGRIGADSVDIRLRIYSECGKESRILIGPW